MPTERRRRDIEAVAYLALGLYVPGGPLRELIDSLVEEIGEVDAEDLALEFVIESVGRELRSLVAISDALELATEASSIAVSYFNTTEELPLGSEGLSDFTHSPLVTLEISQLADGSFFARVRAVFTHPQNRGAVVSIAVLTTAVINIIVPPLVVPGLVVAGVGAISEFVGVIQERREAARVGDDAERVSKEVNAATEREAIMQRRIDEMGRQITELETEVTRIRQDRVDAESIQAAGHTQVTIAVDKAA